MKVLYIIFYNLKRNLRDRKSLVNMILFPIVLILILGTALKSQYSPENIKKAVVYYYNNDKGSISNEFEKFLKSKNISNLIELKKVNSIKDGINSIKGNEKGTFVYINDKFTKDMQDGRKSEITVYNQRDTIQTEIVKNILNGFKSGGNAIYASYSIGGKAKYVDSKNIIDMPIETKGKIPTSIDYYAVTMLVMILMYGSLYGNYSISEIYVEQEGKRVQTTPTKKLEALLGYAGASIITVFLQGMILMLFAKYVFKANYGQNIWIIVFIIFSVSVLSNFIGMTVAVITKNSDKSSNILNLLIVACTFVSGGYSEIISDNKVYNNIVQFIPNGMAQRAMFNSIYGGQSSMVNFNILIIWIGIVLCMIIAILAGRRIAR